MRQIISLAALLSLVGALSAQTPPTTTRPPRTGIYGPNTPPTEKSGLEKAIEEALKNNPDLRVAVAKVHEAEAGLSRARLQVTQKVVNAYQAVELGNATVKIAQTGLERLRRLQKDKLAAAEDVTKAEQELAAAKSKLAAAEADLNYLLGKAASKTLPGSLNLGYYPPSTMLLSRSADPRFSYNPHIVTTYPFPAQAYYSLHSTVRGNIPAAVVPSGDKIRKALDHRVTMKFNDTPARDALKMILKEAQGLHIQAALKDAAWDEKITANLTDMPLGAVLQLLEDALGKHRIVVRGYGLLIVSGEHLPTNAVLLSDFWQGGVKPENPTKGKPATK
jgi:hypothetical protein